MDFFEIRNWFAHRFCDYLREGNPLDLEVLKTVSEAILKREIPAPKEEVKKAILETFPLISEEKGRLKLVELDPFTEEFLTEKAKAYLNYLQGKEVEPTNEDLEKTVKLSVELFNEGFFFEVHELLEEVWSGTFGKEREFLQALIQLGVAFYHRENYNLRGYKLLLENALELLENYHGELFGIKVDKLKEEIKKAYQDAEYPHESLFKNSL